MVEGKKKVTSMAKRQIPMTVMTKMVKCIEKKKKKQVHLSWLREEK
jgi:hypothetical protein